MNSQSLLNMRLLRSFCILLIGSISAFAEDDSPGWQTSPQISSEEVTAWATVSAGQAPGCSVRNNMDPATPLAAAMSLGEAIPQGGPPSAAGNEADKITGAITELARGLRYDPLKIFQYVYNYIDYEAYFGSKKGAHLTLLEGSGNEFDQCALLVALLRAAGHNPTYGYGPCIFSYEDLVAWMGLSAVPYPYWTDLQFAAVYDIDDTSPANIARHRQRHAVKEFLIPRGYFYVESLVLGDDNCFSIPHVWVEFAGHKLSPAFKTYTDTFGIDLASAMGYSRADLLDNVVGGTTENGIEGTLWVKDLNYSALSNRLATYTKNLLDYLHLENAPPNTPNHALSVDAITGNRKIVPAVFASLNNIPQIFVHSDAAWLEVHDWETEIPDVHMSTIELIAGRYDYTTHEWDPQYPRYLNEVIQTPALRGRKLSLTFSGNIGQIRLDETPVGAPFTIPTPFATVDLRLKATHNHFRKKRQSNGTYIIIDQGKHDIKEVKRYRKDNAYAYAITYSFSNPDKLLRNRQEVLDGYRRDGLDATDWRVKTEILNVMGLTWLYQTYQQDRVAAQVFTVLPLYHHRFGRVAQEASYYIDVGLQYASPKSRIQFPPYEGLAFYFSGFVGSAMEHGVIEQQQGEGKNAASTIKMIYRANEVGEKIYRATTSNWNSDVKNALLNYPAEITQEIDTAMASGAEALLPKDGDNHINQWHGLGYALEESGVMTMGISGGIGSLNGGFNSEEGFVNLEPVVDNLIADPAYTMSPDTTLNVPYAPLTTPQQASEEPIDMASGAYFFDKTEMTIGQQAEPRGLRFSRHYNSNRRYDKSGGLGFGWAHNYNIYVTKRSSVKAGLGETISYHAAPFLVSQWVAADLYLNHNSARRWATAALVIHWATEQSSTTAPP